MKIPQGIEIKLIKGTELYVKGPQGVQKAQVTGVREKGGELEAEDQVTRGIIKKMIQGVKTGYKQKIKIQGVGYRAEVQGREIEMHLGYKEPKRVRIPAGVEMTVLGNGTIIEGRSTS
jgi:large subunit ribosomal protein L6